MLDVDGDECEDAVRARSRERGSSARATRETRDARERWRRRRRRGESSCAREDDARRLTARMARAIGAVSYTHLTLPTILLV